MYKIKLLNVLNANFYLNNSLIRNHILLHNKSFIVAFISLKFVTMTSLVEKLINYKNCINQQLHDKSKPWSPIFDAIEENTGIDRIYVFLGTVLLVIVWLMYGFAQQFLCNILAVVYPVYASLQALETNNKEDDTKWLIYWVVYAEFTCIEFFANFIVGWFPLYWLIKSIFMLWLMAPIQHNGSKVLYKEIVRPFFLKQEPNVREAVNKFETTMETVLSASMKHD